MSLAASPFGNPDGSTGPVENLMSGFVQFKSEAVWGGLAMSAADRTARIIVGSKGSGKTAYLRRLHHGAKNEASLFVTEWSSMWLDTELVTRISQYFEPQVLVDTWQRLWRVAFIQSTATHLLFSPEMRDYVPPKELDELRKDFSDLIGSPKGPEDPRVAASRLIVGNSSRNMMSQTLNHADWPHLEARLALLLAKCPPVCLAMDALDDYYEMAPAEWLSCQEGLFLCIVKMLRDHALGNRLHIFCTIRDVVFGAVKRSEHRLRFEGDSHIKVLQWDRRAAEHFLLGKLGQVSRDYFVKPHVAESGVEAWLGRSRVTNGRQQSEQVVPYILRHTRLLPRDVINMGNALCRRIATCKERLANKGEDGCDCELEIRLAVAEEARKICEEQLQTCSREILATMRNPTGGRNQADGSAPGSDRWQSLNPDRMSLEVVEALKYSVVVVGREVFKPSALDKARQKFWAAFPQYHDIDPYSALWRNGLIGHQAKIGGHEAWVFYADSGAESSELPRHKAKYIFHSCVMDCVDIRHGGKLVRFGGKEAQ